MIFFHVQVTIFLRLEVLDAKGLYADNVTNILVHRNVFSRSKNTWNYEQMCSVPSFVTTDNCNHKYTSFAPLYNP